MKHRSLLIGYLILALATAAGLLAVSRQDDTGTSPLGPYPVQHVVTRVDGVDGGAVRLGAAVTIEGRLCSKAEKPVHVRTRIWWQAPGVTGSASEPLILEQVRTPGCEWFTVAKGNPFRNPQPETVQQLVRAGVVRWQVRGDETPIEGPGRGKFTPFRSTTFTVVP